MLRVAVHGETHPRVLLSGVPTRAAIGCPYSALVQSKSEEAWQVLHTREVLECASQRLGYDVDQVMRSMSSLCYTITYIAMLEEGAKCGTVQQASTPVGILREAPAEPDSTAYPTITKGYCFGGDVGRSVQAWKDMKTATSCTWLNHAQSVLDG